MTAAATAAGFMFKNGKIRAPAPQRHEATTRHLDLAGRQHGRVCPHCTERFCESIFETHVLIAHSSAIESRAD